MTGLTGGDYGEHFPRIDLFLCGLSTVDHTPWCLEGNENTPPTAVQVNEMEFTDVVAGPASACATDTELKVYCWGKVDYNQENPTPQLVDVPGEKGPDLFIGREEEGYALVDNTVKFWQGSEPVMMSFHLDQLWPVRVRTRGDACLQVKSGELYCSFTILTRSSFTSLLPTEIIPVPNPVDE